MDKVSGYAVTDASGIAQDLRFRTIRVDSSGLTTETLSGYEISTVAEVEYTTTVADFRYAFEAVTLQDTPGNAATVSLTDNIDTDSVPLPPAQSIMTHSVAVFRNSLPLNIR